MAFKVKKGKMRATAHNGSGRSMLVHNDRPLPIECIDFVKIGAVLAEKSVRFTNRRTNESENEDHLAKAKRTNNQNRKTYPV